MAADLIRATLLYRSGPHRDFPLSDAPEALLGFRGEGVLRVPMEGVSRRHAKITFDGKDYWIEDAGSSNGTFVNGARLRKRERLKHLDVVTLGRSTDLIFSLRAKDAVRVARRGIKGAAIEAVDGADAGTSWPVPRGHITIGRAASNNVVVDSQLISKVHVRLECTGEQLVLTDLQSHNGTYVDAERLVEPRILKEADEFVLAGARRFRVHIEEGIIQTSSVGPLARQSSGAVLPIDWQTRLEWTPEELESFERGRRGDVHPAGSTLREPAPQVPPPAVKLAPKAKPEVKLPPAGAKLEAKPAPAAKMKTDLEAPAVAAKAVVKPPDKVAKAEVEPPAEVPKRAEVAKPAQVAKPVQVAKPPAESAKPAEVPKRAEVAKPAQVAKPPAESAKPAEVPVPPPKPKVEPPAAAVPSVEAPREKADRVPPPKPAPPPTPATSEPDHPRVVRHSGEATKALIHDEASRPRVYLEGTSETVPFTLGNHEVGRLSGLFLRLDAHEISRRHAIIHVSNAEVVVEDLGSHNGTFVNGERITAPRKLSAGDLLTFGDVQFRVRFPPVPGVPRNPE